MDQQMADLPPDRSEVGLPFTNVGIDVFGPWAVQTRRTIGRAANSNCAWQVEQSISRGNGYQFISVFPEALPRHTRTCSAHEM